MTIEDARKLAALIQQHLHQRLWLGLLHGMNDEFTGFEWSEAADQENGRPYIAVRERI
jgi:hypothetical protein